MKVMLGACYWTPAKDLRMRMALVAFYNSGRCDGVRLVLSHEDGLRLVPANDRPPKKRARR